MHKIGQGSGGHRPWACGDIVITWLSMRCRTLLFFLVGQILAEGPEKQARYLLNHHSCGTKSGRTFTQAGAMRVRQCRWEAVCCSAPGRVGHIRSKGLATACSKMRVPQESTCQTYNECWVWQRQRLQGRLHSLPVISCKCHCLCRLLSLAQKDIAWSIFYPQLCCAPWMTVDMHDSHLNGGRSCLSCTRLKPGAFCYLPSGLLMTSRKIAIHYLYPQYAVDKSAWSVWSL